MAWQALLKTAAEYCEHEKRRKYCELCPFEFRPGLLIGITQAIGRYARDNNKYMKDLYNLEEESMYLQYLDANNLYEWARFKIYQHMDFYGRMQTTLPLKK